MMAAYAVLRNGNSSWSLTQPTNLPCAEPSTCFHARKSELLKKLVLNSSLWLFHSFVSDKISLPECFFGLRFFSLPEMGRDKKDAEASKTASSPYKRTAETVFGGRKSENIFYLLKESARIPTSFSKSDYTKAVTKWLVFALSVCTFFSRPEKGEIKSFGVFDFVAQGVLSYVVRRNRAQKKRKH